MQPSSRTDSEHEPPDPRATAILNEGEAAAVRIEMARDAAAGGGPIRAAALLGLLASAAEDVAAAVTRRMQRA